MAKVYDLSQSIENGMTIFPGDPLPRIEPADSAQTPWLVSSLHLGSHTGSHVDAPSHFITGGQTVDQLGVERFVLRGLVVPARGLKDDQAIGVEQFETVLSSLPKGGGVIIRTDWSRFWGTERYFRHPYLSSEAAEALVCAGVGIVGIDALNVDSTVQETSHAHQVLLSQGVLIVENLTGLAQLDYGTIYQFILLPLFLHGLDGSPIRAVALEMEAAA